MGMGRSSRTIDHVVSFLRQQGLRHVFGVGGANIEDLYDALHGAGDDGEAPTGLVAKHEFSAATMADGYHRAGGGPAVIVATSGAGAMNLVPGLAELRASAVPALALIGQPPTELDGLGSFQETSGLAGSIDAVRLFGEIAVFCARVDDPARITELLPAALEAALGPVPGPAVLLLPKDVQQAKLPHPVPARPVVPTRRPLSPATAREAAKTLLTRAAAERGVTVIAGTSVVRADARAELEAFSESLNAPVAVAPDARDAFDNRHPLFLGVSGAIGHAAVVEAVAGASAVVLAGTRLPQLAGGALRETLKDVPVVCLDASPPFLTADHTELVHLDGPLREELAALTERLGAASQGRPHPPTPADRPGTGTAAAQSAVRDASAPHAELGLRTLMGALQLLLPPRTNIVVDAGNTGAAAIHYLPTPPGGRFIVAQGMGGMGHSFGAAVGACLATGEPTVVVAGDGSFYMHGMEVHTAAELGLPITYLIVNNNAHAMCHTRERVFFSGDYSYNLFRPARIGPGVAELFPGIPGHEVTGLDQLTRSLTAPPARGPLLVSVTVDPHEVPPFEPFNRPWVSRS